MDLSLIYRQFALEDDVKTRDFPSAGAACASRCAGYVLAAAIFACLAAAPAAAHSLKQLEDSLRQREAYVQIVREPAPEFTLEDARGHEVGLADFRGKVVVLNFVYTNCPDICPLHSERIAELQRMINPTPMRELVRFISITTDPAHDTWPVMKGYGPDHGLDPANWVFLTSGPEAPDATRDLAKDYGLKFMLTDSGYQLHALVTFLIDKSGNIRARYHGLKFHPTNFVIQVNALTNDDH
jgi:protein SCO1/2